jgi:threonine dehydrogenase-like Zn-dependent dehydrogenase
MTKKMKAIVWDGRNFPEGLTYQDFDIPEPPPRWVLVYNRAAGICGSDLHYLLGYMRQWIPDKNLPAILGHENASVVVKLGEGVTTVKVGDRVAVEPLHGCTEFGKTCPACRIGKYHLCQNGLTHVGLPLERMLPGGYGEYSIVHETRLFQIPENVTFEEAALLDILAVGVHTVKLVRPGMGDSTVVYGCGILGLDLIQCLKVEGVRDIIAIGKYDFQVDMAKQLGATETVLIKDDLDPVKEVMRITGGQGVNQAYECVGGETDALDQAVQMCSFGGQAVMLGVFPGQRPINLFLMLWREINIISSDSYSTAGTQREFQIALDLLRDRKVDHKSLISYRYKPEQWKDAINMAIAKGKGKAFKVLFTRD